MRRTFLDDACAGRPELRARLDVLLRAHEQPDPFFESPPSKLAFASLQATQTEAVGDEIGPYKLLEEMGERGFGVVYMAEQQEPVRRNVALKTIKLRLTRSSTR